MPLEVLQFDKASTKLGSLENEKEGKASKSFKKIEKFCLSLNSFLLLDDSQSSQKANELRNGASIDNHSPTPKSQYSRLFKDFSHLSVLGNT